MTGEPASKNIDSAAENTEEVVLRGQNLRRTYTRSPARSRLMPWRQRDTDALSHTVVALDDLSIEIRRGEIVGVAGPSGSGKSTLLHVLAGLDRPTTGQIEFDGTNLTELSNRERTRFRLDHVGLVFQRFHLLETLSARANVALPLVERGIGKRTRQTRATDLLEQVGLGDRIGHTPNELSGGECQRVAIARALVTDPTILIADEPTGELDTETSRTILSLFESIAEERAVVIASHDQQTLDIADRLIRLRDGAIEQIEET